MKSMRVMSILARSCSGHAAQPVVEVTWTEEEPAGHVTPPVRRLSPACFADLVEAGVIEQVVAASRTVEHQLVAVSCYPRNTPYRSRKSDLPTGRAASARDRCRAARAAWRVLPFRP